jgi:hypothetical protein
LLSRIEAKEAALALTANCMIRTAFQPNEAEAAEETAQEMFDADRAVRLTGTGPP